MNAKHISTTNERTNLMATFKIPITKAGKDAFIEVNTADPEAGGDLTSEMYEEAMKLGLKAMLNRGMDKIQVAKLEGDKLKDAQAAALEKAQANLAAIKSGSLKKTSARAAKVTGVLNTEAMRIARNMVKDGLKEKGYKVSYYPASEITIAAKALIEVRPEILGMAQTNLDARDAAKSAASEALANVMTLAKPSAKLQADAEAKKAAAKTQLSAKQAGKPTKHKPKPTAQTSATVQ